MPEILHGIAISGSILIGVVILIIIVSYVTVRRGETAMREDVKEHGGPARH
ncbi:MAG TPA: hypothetical protein VER98_02315 [Terriglobia bacterium]|nr:hypothetical protein [Terriglobia bacterium]